MVKMRAIVDSKK